ncbi:FERM domain-containing protein 7, partial [Cichlidogyrus casuarinus]
MDTKLVPVRVYFLDGSSETFRLLLRCPGQELFDMVMNKLDITEADYFDIQYIDKEGNLCWLDHFKPLAKPLSVIATTPPQFEFAVKFYTSHPNLLEDEYTRFLYALQIKKDLYMGKLVCTEDTTAVLAAFIIQSECGDYTESIHRDFSYIKKLKVIKNPSERILCKVQELHKSLIGTPTVDSDYHLLDAVRKVDLYGIQMHPAKDNENLPLNLSVSHKGIHVFQGLNHINVFNWSKIRKLSFKRKKFLIKLHPEGYMDLFMVWLVEGYYKDMVEFFFDSRDACKNFWKKCVEHHAFFRSQSMLGRPGAGAGGSTGGIFQACTGVTNRKPHPYKSSAEATYASTFKRSPTKSPSKVVNRNTTSPVATGPVFVLEDSAGSTTTTGQPSNPANKNSGLGQLSAEQIKQLDTVDVSELVEKKPIFHFKGSTYRYLGRTQRQLLESSRESSHNSLPPCRRSRSTSASVGNHHQQSNGSSSLPREPRHSNKEMENHYKLLMLTMHANDPYSDFRYPTLDSESERSPELQNPDDQIFPKIARVPRVFDRQLPSTWNHHSKPNKQKKPISNGKIAHKRLQTPVSPILSPPLDSSFETDYIHTTKDHDAINNTSRLSPDPDSARVCYNAAPIGPEVVDTALDRVCASLAKQPPEPVLTLPFSPDQVDIIHDADDILLARNSRYPNAPQCVGYSPPEYDSDQEQPSSIVGATSLGAISMMTGVSCIDDDDGTCTQIMIQIS